MDKEHRILFNTPNTHFKNNRSNRSNHTIFVTPFLTIKRYFFWNYENLYFLLLSMFQLMTLSILPREWSPTGPYSTAIPLLLCVILEILSDIYGWLKNWRLDYRNNNRVVECYDNIYKKNQDLRPGDVIKVYKGDIVPVDGILVGCEGGEYGKICLAPLNGESNIHCIDKPKDFKKLLDYRDCSLEITNYYNNNFSNFGGKIYIDDKIIYVDGSSFVVSNSIVMSKSLYVWTTRCGDQRKSYIKSGDSIRSSRLDDHVSNYMINISTYILMALITTVSFVKLVYLKTSNILFNIIFFGVQNWIIFNGVIPFSVKILLILIRSIQANLLNRKTNMTTNTPLLIDDINKVNKIVTDKTGTLTKNELEFSKLIQTNTDYIVDIETFSDTKTQLNIDLVKCLGICIHQTEDDFSTIEDKTIRYRYQYLNSRVMQTDGNIVIIIDDNKYKYKYLEIAGLDFTYSRKMSSKIVKDTNNRYFIFSKGSVDTMKSKINKKYRNELDRLDSLISAKHPDLRLLACAYREVSVKEIEACTLHYGNNSGSLENVEKGMYLLGIIGIKDNIQQGVYSVINNLKNISLETSMCTGDRKITAIAVAMESGIIDKNSIVVDYDDGNFMGIEAAGKTLIFSGSFFHKIRNRIDSYNIFKKHICEAKNFIGYNLIPEDKRRLVKIYENSGIKTLSIGDGLNDIAMFKTSSISVGIKRNCMVENSADFVVNEFRQLDDLIRKIGPNYYFKNTILSNFTFYRTIIVVICLATYCLIRYNLPTVAIFNGFVIQGFNFAWCIVPIVYNCIRIDYNNNHNRFEDYNRSKDKKLSNILHTSKWNFNGLLVGMFITIYSYNRYGMLEYYNDLLALLIIITINYKTVFSGCRKMGDILGMCVGIILFLIYTMFNGSFYGICNTLVSFSGLYFLVKLYGFITVVNILL